MKREDQARRLDLMFCRTYQGGVAKEFSDALKTYGKIFDHTKHFGRCIFIVQSSGTGKSRLVKELRNYVRLRCAAALFKLN
jgi:hypothetical protein